MSHLKRGMPLAVLNILLCSILLLAPLPSVRGQAPAESVPSLLAKGSGYLKQDGRSSLVPIVFVPGTAASELRLTNLSQKKSDVLFWLGRPTFKKNAIALGSLDECGNDLAGNTVAVSQPLAATKAPIVSQPVPIYSNFLAWARAVFPDRFHVAAYDWRKGAGLESSERLDRVIDEALKNSGQKKVILLAHSLGGLVSRDYILRKGSGKVAALIAVGTPWLGLPKSVRALVWGYNFEAGIVKPSPGSIPIDGLEDYSSSMCANGKCQHLDRISFLKMEDVRKLARNFPAVYQQLPTEDFMKEYGQAENKNIKSVLWGKETWEAMRNLYAETNPCLFQKTESWRGDYINGNDLGVKHYLIGGIYDPECRKGDNKDCRIENRMDMQMPSPNQVSKSNFSKGYSALIKGLNILLSIVKYSAHRDPFVALDSDYEWGDGTTPLLSATAGEYVRSDKEPVNRGRAAHYLGAKTETQAVTLGAKYGHSAMLDDPGVRQLILKDYKTESLKLNMNGAVPEDIAEVSSVEIKISAGDNGVKNIIRTTLVGPNVELSASEIFIPGRRIKFKKLEVTDSVLMLPKEKHNSSADYVQRTLLTSEIPGLTLQLRASHNSGHTLHVTSIEVFVNGTRQFEYSEPFELISGKDRSFSLGGQKSP
jgi:pimeloyl-ACP methyl ester carboxylesterase